jgi:proteic killer suppression protein
MIESFRHKGLREFFETGDSAKIAAEHKKRLRLILTLLNAAGDARDMNFPGSNLHRLKGKLKDFWAVKVSGNWRIIFRFENGKALDVDYLDYH